MRIRHAKALGIIVAVEAVLLIIVVAAALRSERHTSFPPAVPAPVAVPSAGARVTAVPVSLNLGLKGVTRTTAATLTRGGRANDVGRVGLKRVGASGR